MVQVYKWMLDMSLSRKERNAEDRWHVSAGGLDSSVSLVGVGCNEKTTSAEGAELEKTELVVRGVGDSEQ